MLLHLQLQICPYFIDLWFSQLNNGLSRLLECCHFASVCNEGLHDSWSGRQNDWSVQVGIKPLLARKKNRLYPGTFVVGAGMFHLTRFFSSHYKWPECNDEKHKVILVSHTTLNGPKILDQAPLNSISFFINKVDRFLTRPLYFHWQLLLIKRSIWRFILEKILHL